MGPIIRTLRIKILDKKFFKSNHYWLMSVIGKMPSLKVMKIHKDHIITLSEDAFRFMHKGFKYFQQNGGNLTKIHLSNVLGGSSSEYLY